MQKIILLFIVVSFFVVNNYIIYALNDSKTNDNLAKEIKSTDYGEYYFGFIFDGKVFVDETHEYNTSGTRKAIMFERIWDNNSNRMISGKSTGWNYIIFNELLSELKEYTIFSKNDPAYISTVYGVFNSKLIGYSLLAITGIKFYDVFNLSSPFSKYDFNFDNNFVLLSSSPDISAINSVEVTNDNIDRHLEGFRKKLVFVKGMGNDDFNKSSEEFKIIRINTNLEEGAFVASYTYKYEGIYANAVYLFNGSGKILKTLRAFKAPNKNDIKKWNYTDFGEYYTVLGTIDVNLDGEDEIILYNGYYEGGSYELWGIENGGFVMITNGIVEGT